MIVKIIAEELDVRDSSSSNVGVRKVTWEENKGHVANIIRGSQTRDVPDLEWGVPVCE
jgi:hypothetical protein